MTIYEEKGFENRMAYLKFLANSYGVDEVDVVATAYLLGEDEDFDGLVTFLEDEGGLS